MKKRRTLLITDYCLTPHKRINRSGILFENEQILAIGGASAFIIEPDLDVIEFKNSYAMPGLFDAHIHGAGGFDSSAPDDDKKSILDMSCVLVKHGITSYVPTIVSSPAKLMLPNIAKLADIISNIKMGPEPIGIHIEGPFISKEKHGSQLEDGLLDEVDFGLLKEIIKAGNGKLKKMTFAPEIKGAVKLVETLCEYNIQPSMGHSMALEDDTMRAIAAGARNCTHLFNGMPDLHQRKISLTAIALTDSRVTVELILDGKHLHPAPQSRDTHNDQFLYGGNDQYACAGRECDAFPGGRFILFEVIEHGQCRESQQTEQVNSGGKPRSVDREK